MAFEDWPEFKESGECEFDQLPMLEHSGRKLVGSRAIARFIATLHNMYPTEAKGAYAVESIID